MRFGRRRGTDVNGFTVVEVAVAVAILGVLISWGTIEFAKALERQYRRQAREILLAISTGEQTYYTIENTYYDPDEPGASWERLHMEDPNPPDGLIRYTVEQVEGVGPRATFLAKAIRQKGPLAGRELTLDQNQTFGGSW